MVTESSNIQIVGQAPHPQTVGDHRKSVGGILATPEGRFSVMQNKKTPVELGSPSHQSLCGLFPLDGVGSAVPSLQLHPVFGIDTERVPPNDAMSRFVGFGDKSWDNLKNFFQTQGFEFLFLSQSARRVAFGGSMAPKTPVLKLNRPFARKPPAAIASELTRVACAPFAKPQVAGLRHS